MFRKVQKKTTVKEVKSIVVELLCKDTNANNDISLFATKDKTKYLKIVQRKM